MVGDSLASGSDENNAIVWRFSTGTTGGFTSFIKDRRLYCDYEVGVNYTLEPPPLPEGDTELKFDFIRSGDFAGTGELYVNGEKVAETEMPIMHISSYSLAAAFDIGRSDD